MVMVYFTFKMIVAMAVRLKSKRAVNSFIPTGGINEHVSSVSYSG